MLILYGSQGGTSKEAARLIEAIIRFGYSEQYICEIKGIYEAESMLEMDNFDVEKIFDIECIIFVCSTHGNGTEPFNMTRFWNTLKKLKQPDILSHLKFAVFGLGDSSYESYNYCSKKLYNLLKLLGARSIMRRGCGDAQDTEGWIQDFRPWIKELLTHDSFKTQPLEKASIYKKQNSGLYNVQILKKTTLTPMDFKPETIELELLIKNYNQFKPGDCLAIMPTNYNIEELMDYFGVEKSQINEMDLNGIPQLPFFSFLYQYITVNNIDCSREKLDRIEELYKNYGIYHDYIFTPKRTIFEVLKELELKPSIEFLSQFVPKITYRYFTLTKKNDIYSIVASIVEYKTVMKEPRKGLVSEYLKSISKNIVCKIGKSLINIKKGKILIICTGAGISIANSMVNFYTDSSFVIFYGFRWYKKDCFDKEITNRPNVKIFHASSRDDNKYVQDVFKLNPVANINEYDIVVSGNSRLNKIVSDLFKELYCEKTPFYCETW